MLNARIRVLLLLLLLSLLCGSSRSWSSQAKPGASALSQAKAQLINTMSSSDFETRPLNDKILGKAVRQLEKCAREDASLARFDPTQVVGCWKVIHAPHIAGLSRFAFTRFQPIEYHLTEDMKIASSVRYRGLLNGWLSTSGFYKVEKDSGNVIIVWDKVWWNISESDRPTPPQEGVLADIIQRIGMIGFIKPLSFFPVKYVDNDIAIFNFFFFCITAARVAEPASNGVFVSRKDGKKSGLDNIR